jgi:hypothetical protein
MNKTILFAVAPMLIVFQATAQTVSPTVSKSSGREVVESSQNLAAPGQVNQSAPGTVSQPTQVVNVQSSAPVSTPVTVVEDSPLRESRADGIRRQRMEIETETEQKIVEKLESERIRAERERSEKLSKALDGKMEESERPVVQAAPIQPQVVYVREPAPVVEATTKAVPEKETSKNRFQISGMGGIGDYPSLSNVKGIYSAGVTAGMQFDDHFIVEGGWLFSSFDVQPIDPYNPYANSAYYPVIKSMDQSNFFGGVKYLLLDGKVRPNFGGLLGYTRRVYKDRQYYYPGPEITSNAFDAGLSSGLDVNLSDNFSIGMDLRYLFNLSYRVNGAPQTSIINPSQFNRPVEEYSYYLVTIGARFTF